MNTNEANEAGWKYTERKVINIVKEMEPIMAEHGFHLAAGGSCIYRGGSNKDMDIIVYPHKGDVPAWQLKYGLRKLLNSYGFAKYVTPEMVKQADTATNVPDVLVTYREKDNARVDWFIMDRPVYPSHIEYMAWLNRQPSDILDEPHTPGSALPPGPGDVF
jgi:hypothetical protein